MYYVHFCEKNVGVPFYLLITTFHSNCLLGWSLFKQFSFVIHFGAACVNLSRGDVFPLLSDDFSDLFRTRHAPCNKAVYLPFHVKYVSCGILRLVFICLEVQYFSHDCAMIDIVMASASFP